MGGAPVLLLLLLMLVLLLRNDGEAGEGGDGGVFGGVDLETVSAGSSNFQQTVARERERVRENGRRVLVNGAAGFEP